MTMKLTTIKIDDQQQRSLIELAKRLGYTSRFRTELTGNLTGLLRAIADGEVVVSRGCSCAESREEYRLG